MVRHGTAHRVQVQLSAVEHYITNRTVLGKKHSKLNP